VLPKKTKKKERKKNLKEEKRQTVRKGWGHDSSSRSLPSKLEVLSSAQ
jgi:hypothetical protein